MSRLIKQLAYGLFYLAFVAIFSYGAYLLLLKPAPTCTDAIQNRDETEIDCGGAYCVSCEIKHLKPIDTSRPVKIVSGGSPDTASAIVEIRNNNPKYGLTVFSYIFNVYTTSTSTPAYREKLDLPMYPGEVKYRVSINMPFAPSAVTRAEVVPFETNGLWRSAVEFPKPNLPVREVKIETRGERLVISGIVRNDSVVSMRRVTVTALFEQAEGIVSASRTVISDLPVSEERGFQVVALKPELSEGVLLSAPKIIVDGEW